jgi:hypothetical protein
MATAIPLDIDPIRAACDRAPIVHQLTPEQRAELDQDMADIAAGRMQVIAHEDMPAALEALRRERSA